MSGLALASRSGRPAMAVLSFALRRPGQVVFLTGLFGLACWSLSL